ncbi:hypothetical protein [Sphingorhabdus sp.]|uniref:hypothetical protein n=1 Tax=Sphingorhabdus sp. TaxID=1902408 RepID=UPI0032B74112
MNGILQNNSKESLPKLAAIVWLLAAAFLIYSSWPNIVSRSGWDPDDQLRMVQLRDFLGGQSWFDTTQYRLNAPEGGPMHWSRLIELPLAIIIIMAAPIFGQAGAEMIAGTVIPLMCFASIAYILGRVAMSLGGRLAGGIAVVMTMMSPAISMQLRPMRIDHHGWQLFCAALTLWTLFWPSARKAGIVMGMAMAVWLHISLEGAPAAAAFFAILGWRWAFKGDDAQRLGWAVLAFTSVSLLLFFGTQAAGLSATNFCDTISPAHIYAIAAAGMLIAPSALLLQLGRIPRVTIVLAAAVTSAVIYLNAAPDCARGAFSTMDPVVRAYWYDMVREGLPVWHQKWGTAILMLALPVVGLATLAILLIRADVEQRANYAIIAFLSVYTLLLSLLVFRTVSTATLVATPVVAIGVAKLFSRYRTEPVALRRIGLVALMVLMLIPGPYFSQIFKMLSPQTAKNQQEVAGEKGSEAGQCESSESVRSLDALKQANIVAPFDIGPKILLNTPHSVVASSHHRNEKGMRAHIDIYRLPPAQARAIVQRRKVTHIVACSDEAEMKGYARRNREGLWAQLAKGNTPDWLEKMPDMGEGLKVWRVR